MFERISLTLNGIEGMLVDHGHSGYYWEVVLQPQTLQQFVADKRCNPMTVHINGEDAGYGVIQQSWVNLETGSILVKFLYERSTWPEEPLISPKRRREDRISAQKEEQTA